MRHRNSPFSSGDITLMLVMVIVLACIQAPTEVQAPLALAVAACLADPGRRRAKP
jgi:hypothetical protein